MSKDRDLRHRHYSQPWLAPLALARGVPNAPCAGVLGAVPTRDVNAVSYAVPEPAFRQLVGILTAFLLESGTGAGAGSHKWESGGEGGDSGEGESIQYPVFSIQ